MAEKTNCMIKSIFNLYYVSMPLHSNKYACQNSLNANCEYVIEIGGQLQRIVTLCQAEVTEVISTECCNCCCEYYFVYLPSSLPMFSKIEMVLLRPMLYPSTEFNDFDYFLKTMVQSTTAFKKCLKKNLISDKSNTHFGSPRGHSGTLTNFPALLD